MSALTFAQSLVAKLDGHTHTMPKSILTKRDVAKLGISARPPTGKYVDEDGIPTTCLLIAIKNNASEAKVRKLFKDNTIEEAYRLVKTDLRSSNGQGGIYFLPCGTESTAEGVGEYYHVSRRTVQKYWADSGKDPVLANKCLTDSFGAGK